MKFWRTREFATALVLVAMLLTCEAASRLGGRGAFLTAGNLGRIFQDCSFVGIAAIGAAVVLISGGVDLSSGLVMGLSAVTLGHLYVGRGWSPGAALAAGVLAGAATGLVNGLLISRLKMPPFIATLGMLSVARGLSYWITGGITISLNWEDRGATFFAFPLLGNHSLWVMAGLGAAAALLMARFRWGRYVYAVGGNEEASRYAGLDIPWIKTGLYAAAGLFTGIAGCAYALRYGSAYVALGQGYELQIIAACAIGGVSFTGGQGSVAGALLGAATLQVLRELLLQLGVRDQYIDIAFGCAIWLAAAVELLRGRSGWVRWFGGKPS